jgi:hypothetical protein
MGDLYCPAVQAAEDVRLGTWCWCWCGWYGNALLSDDEILRKHCVDEHCAAEVQAITAILCRIPACFLPCSEQPCSYMVLTSSDRHL